MDYVGSFATPTLTDTWVKPNKTARINFGKHTKMAYCPLTKLLYICGGDGQGWHFGGNDSGTIDTVATYNVATHTYAEDFLYRGAAGEVTPRGLDFIAFSWRPSINEFWLGPGFAWDYAITADTYPWLDTSYNHFSFASYSPVTRRWTSRAPRSGLGIYTEGRAGSWDTRRDKLIYFLGTRLTSIDPATGIGEALWVSGTDTMTSHRIETADTWYDEETDDLYFVQLATGKVYACNVGKRAVRLVAATGVTAGNPDTDAVVYITDSKYCLIVYHVSFGGGLSWKLVNLKTGAVKHLNLFAPGCDYHNTGCYHPPTKTIILTGGSSGSHPGADNLKNGASFHHYRSNL